MLTASKLSHSPVPRQGDKKVQVIPPVDQAGGYNQPPLSSTMGARAPAPPSHHSKRKASPLSLFFEATFEPAWEACPALLRERHDRLSKPLHTLWVRTYVTSLFPHLNQILWGREGAHRTSAVPTTILTLISLPIKRKHLMKPADRTMFTHCCKGSMKRTVIKACELVSEGGGRCTICLLAGSYRTLRLHLVTLSNGSYLFYMSKVVPLVRYIF